MRTRSVKVSKRQRLEAKGWKVGTAASFLNLTAAEEAYVAIKLALARRLAARRKQMGCSQVDLAKRLQSSQSRIAKMEAGDASVTVDLLVRSLLQMGLTVGDVGKTVATAN